MRLFLIFALFVGGINAFAQDIVMIDTVGQESRRSLIDLYSKRVDAQKASFEKQITDKKIRKEVDESYVKFSTDFIENINNGYFSDDKIYGAFLEGIVDAVRKNNPEYPNIANTKILLSFGISPNAYAIGNDIVVVTVPLIRNIENEYELAFIISHEIAHNLLLHSYNGMIEYAVMTNSAEIKKQTRDIEKKKYHKGKIASGLYRDIVYGKRKNSRRLEHQADSLGFVLYRNTFRGKEYQAVKSLETLNDIDRQKDSLQPQDYVKLFNTEKTPFKMEWIENEELSSYKYDRQPKFWQIDSLKTHPDCGIRAGFVQKHFMVKTTDANVPSYEFTRLKKSSVYNHILGLFVIEEYGRSLYETMLLLKDDQNNTFLKNMMCQNFKKIQDAQKTYTLNKHLDTMKPSFSNSYNTFLYFVRQLRKSDINAIIEKYNPT